MATSTTQELRLYGVEGYNNGPEIMDRICKELYSNEKYGEARSIKIEDIDNILEYNINGGYYGIRTNEDDVQIYEFEGKLKEMPIWEDIVRTRTYYTPDGINTVEKLGEYELNGHGYEILELNKEGAIISSPAINTNEGMKEISRNIAETICTNQYGKKDYYFLATQGIIAEPNIVAFGLGSVKGDSYIRSFCDVYFSTGGSEYVKDSICPVVELKNEIPKTILPPEEYRIENWEEVNL